jgi:hypothetical protein
MKTFGVHDTLSLAEVAEGRQGQWRTARPAVSVLAPIRPSAPANAGFEPVPLRVGVSRRLNPPADRQRVGARMQQYLIELRWFSCCSLGASLGTTVAT